MRRATIALALTCGCGLFRTATAPAPAPTTAAVARPIDVPSTGVVVTAESSLGRPVELVAVIDTHVAAATEGEAIALLESWAVRIGGSAVLDARFEASTAEEPAHVSGVVVRERGVDPRTYEEIARIDVQTDALAPNKGLDALRDRAHQLGADKVIDIRFDHDGPDGHSHLHGLAVRYRR